MCVYVYVSHTCRDSVYIAEGPCWFCGLTLDLLWSPCSCPVITGLCLTVVSIAGPDLCLDFLACCQVSWAALASTSGHALLPGHSCPSLHSAHWESLSFRAVLATAAPIISDACTLSENRQKVMLKYAHSDATTTNTVSGLLVCTVLFCPCCITWSARKILDRLLRVL